MLYSSSHAWRNAMRSSEHWEAENSMLICKKFACNKARSGKYHKEILFRSTVEKLRLCLDLSPEEGLARFCRKPDGFHRSGTTTARRRSPRLVHNRQICTSESDGLGLGKDPSSTSVRSVPPCFGIWEMARCMILHVNVLTQVE